MVCEIPVCNFILDEKKVWNVLKYAPVTNIQSTYLSEISKSLESLGSFTNTSTKLNFENAISNNFYDMFFYFGEGNANCMVDENNYCIIYPENYLKDKWIVMTGCNQGLSYTKQAVRIYFATASLGYAQILATQFSNGGFISGFDECVKKAQEVMLNSNILDESVLIASYEQTKALYEYWANYHIINGNAIAGSLFRADANNLLYYSKWDEPTTININISPIPSEVYHFGNYIGLAPINNYNLMSGGNVFEYKSIGCYSTWFIQNIPKNGGTYNLTPMTLLDTTVLHFESYMIYAEIENVVSINEMDTIKLIPVNIYNYSDNTISSLYVNNSKNWPLFCSPTGNIPPHNSRRCNIIINISEYTFTCLPQQDKIQVMIGINGTFQFADVLIFISPLQSCYLGELPETLLSSYSLLPVVQQYNKMTRDEQIQKNILINKRLYSPEDIMQEIMKHSEIGKIFL